MTRATKAALLSGLVFPGAGHLLLKKHLRGFTLLIASLVAMSIIVRKIFQQALTVVDQINSGDIPADTEAIAEMLANSSSGTDGFAESAAFIVLLACWLIGIVDSYRLGRHDPESVRSDQLKRL